jgi:hypothetical protein
LFKTLLGDGEQWGMRFEYVAQPSPDGLGASLHPDRQGLSWPVQPSCLVLGDNIFYGPGFSDRRCASAPTRATEGATVFGYWVQDPERYGVAEFDADGRVIGLEEKPVKPRSHYAVTGLYILRRSRAGVGCPSSNLRRAVSWKSPISIKVLSGRWQHYVWSNWAAVMPGWIRVRTSHCSQPGNYIETIEAAPRLCAFVARKRLPTRMAGSAKPSLRALATHL